MFHEISAVGMRNVTAGFGKYKLEEIGQAFKSTSNLTEKNYILPKTKGGSNTHIQHVLVRVLPSGVGAFQSCVGFKNYICWTKKIVHSSQQGSAERIEPCSLLSLQLRYLGRLS